MQRLLLWFCNEAASFAEVPIFALFFLNRFLELYGRYFKTVLFYQMCIKFPNGKGVFFCDSFLSARFFFS